MATRLEQIDDAGNHLRIFSSSKDLRDLQDIPAYKDVSRYLEQQLKDAQEQFEHAEDWDQVNRIKGSIAALRVALEAPEYLRQQIEDSYADER